MILTRSLFPLLLLGVSATFANSISSAAPSNETEPEPELKSPETSQTETPSDKKLVCYWGSWAYFRPDDCRHDVKYIDATLCTHLVYGFSGLNENTCEMESTSPYLDLVENGGLGKYREFNELKKQNPNLKTMIAVGGWNEGSEKYSKMAADPTCRSLFIASVVKFLAWHEFDGLELAWEYPANRGGVPADKQNFAVLCKELKEGLSKLNYILSAAVGANGYIMDTAYDVARLGQYLDFINLMTYDFHGSWESKTGFHSALYADSSEIGDERMWNTNYAVMYWLNRGCPREKLILAIGTYGRGWILADAGQTGVGAPAFSGISPAPCTASDGFWGYNEICERIQEGGWTVVWDDERKVHYAHKDKFWISYDEPRSVAVKCDYINALRLGGAMVWSVETDDFNGKCGREYPLLKTINDKLGLKASQVTTSTTPSTPSTTTPVPCKEPEPDCKNSEYLPHPRSCEHYYNCTTGVPNLEENGRFGLYWNQNILTCDYPQNVDCVSDPSYCLPP